MAPREKTDTEELSDAEVEQSIQDLRLMGNSWRDIEKKTGVNYETARRIFTKARRRIIKQRTDFKMQTHIAEELERYNMLIREAWDGWLRSVGEMEKSTSVSGETSKGSIETDTVVSWVQAGDPEFIKTIDSLMVNRNRLLGAYEKDRDDDDEITAVRFEQNVYLPGGMELTPELMALLISAIEARDDE